MYTYTSTKLYLLSRWLAIHKHGAVVYESVGIFQLKGIYQVILLRHTQADIRFLGIDNQDIYIYLYTLLNNNNTKNDFYVK